jgi:hypothetical protein
LFSSIPDLRFAGLIAAASITDQKKSVLPFLIDLFLCLVLLAIFPALAAYLPKMKRAAGSGRLLFFQVQLGRQP